ncbi:hypothetical protein B5J93_06445 [Moraxella equi]|uniref:Uncharacterized protein n=1 Tax=Moraxella equi TaxID=60442 RepID=A0ABX3NI33_9GAMM|nr:hypothetical protein B5J93_06445 [Moraxella equi]
MLKNPRAFVLGFCFYLLNKFTNQLKSAPFGIFKTMVLLGVLFMPFGDINPQKYYCLAPPKRL